MVKNSPALFLFPRTWLTLVALVDLGQQSGVYSASSGDSLCFRLLNKKGGEKKKKLQVVWFSKISKQANSGS